MKIAEAREWVNKNYDKEALAALVKPIFRNEYLGDVSDHLKDGKSVPLSALIQSLQEMQEEYPTAYVILDVGWERTDMEVSYRKRIRDETVEEVRERLTKDYQREQNSIERKQAREEKAEEKRRKKEEREFALYAELRSKYGGID